MSDERIESLCCKLTPLIQARNREKSESSRKAFEKAIERLIKELKEVCKEA